MPQVQYIQYNKKDLLGSFQPRQLGKCIYCFFRLKHNLLLGQHLKGTVAREFFLKLTLWGDRLGPTNKPEPLFKFLYSPFNLLRYFKDGVHRSKIDNILVSDPDSSGCFRY